MWSWEVPWQRPEWWIPIVDRLVQAGVTHWAVKVADGTSKMNGPNLAPAAAYAQAQGLHVWAWGYVRDNRFSNAVQEGTLLGQRASAMEANGVILDIEREWQRDDRAAIVQLTGNVRRTFQGPMYGSSYSTVSLHPEFPWDQFTPALDGWMAQVYQVPAAEWALRSYTEFTKLGKDVILTGIGSTQMGSASDTQAFLQQCQALDCCANLWEYSEMNDLMWQVVQSFTRKGGDA